MMEQEIHFIYNEIQDRLNKDVEKLLFQIRNPLAGKKLDVLMKITKQMVIARAKQIEQQREIHNQQLKKQQKAAEPEATLSPQYQPSAVEQIDVEEPEFQVAGGAEEKKREEMKKIVSMNLIIDSETDEVLAKADVSDDEYIVFEPDLSDSDKLLLRQAENDLNRDQSVIESRHALLKQMYKSAKAVKIEFYDDDYLKFRYYIVRDFLGYNVIEPLTHDAAVEKIVCDGPGAHLTVIRKGKKINTNVFFASKDDLNEFLSRISEKTFQRISIEEPVIDAVFRNFRIQGILGTDIVPTKFIMTRV